MTERLDERDDILQFLEGVFNGIRKAYWDRLREFVAANPELVKIVPGFLLAPNEVVLYLGPAHMAIEYVGNEQLQALPDKFCAHVSYIDLSTSGEDFINKIVGIDYQGSVKIPLIGLVPNLILPTNDAVDLLVEQGWNWAAQDMLAPLNTSGMLAVPGHFTRIVDGRFYGTNGKNLKTRHIKWLEIVPFEKQKLA